MLLEVPAPANYTGEHLYTQWVPPASLGNRTVSLATSVPTATVGVFFVSSFDACVCTWGLILGWHTGPTTVFVAVPSVEVGNVTEQAWVAECGMGEPVM